MWCPHSAAGAEVWARLPGELRSDGPWAVGATAHPAKFPEIVEPLIGRAVDVPPALEALLRRETSATEIAPELDALAQALGQ